MVNRLYCDGEVSSEVIEALKYAEENADITIFFPHWGTEYQHVESANQKKVAKILAENGADVIIGTHPHVIEPLKEIITSDGRSVPCFYSIGNFVSGQSEIPRMLGALAEITIINDNGNVYVGDAKMTGVVTQISAGKTDYNVYLLDDYTEELARSHDLYDSKGLTAEELKDIWDEVTSQNTYPALNN